MCVCVMVSQPPRMGLLAWYMNRQIDCFLLYLQTALQAISKIDNPELVLPKAREYAHNTLKVCANQWKLIKDPDAEED